MFIDRASGKLAKRPELQQALNYLRAGEDTLVVTKLDRLGRSVKNLKELADELQTRNIGLIALSQGIDTTTPGGRLFFHMLAAIAEFEHDLIVERTREGLAAARARGRNGGRKPTMTAEKIARARQMYDERKYTVAEIARTVGVSASHDLPAPRGPVTMIARGPRERAESPQQGSLPICAQRHMRTVLLASSPGVWREALAWLHGGGRGMRGSWNSIYGASPRRMPMTGSPQSATHPPQRPSRRWSVANSASTFLRQTATETPRMNKYGLIAQEHWKKYAPARYATLTDPDEYFRTRGGERSESDRPDRIQPGTTARPGSSVPGESGTDELDPPAGGGDRAERPGVLDRERAAEPGAELEEMLGDLPTPSSILATIDRIREDADDEAEREHSSTSILSEAQERSSRSWPRSCRWCRCRNSRTR